MKAWFFRLHRWLALAFALPLALVIGSGLILSVEPWLVESGIQTNALDAARVLSILDRNDPGGQARMLAYRSYDNTLTLGGRPGGAGMGAATVIDATTGAVLPGPSTLAKVMVTARRLHETLLLDAGWLVTASTIAMLAIIALGLAMGLPRFANTMQGWHKAIAWGVLPLVVLSPLTGLFMALGLTFAGGTPPAAQGALPTLREAVAILGESHDLSNLIWIRNQGPRLMARLDEGGAYKAYEVTQDGAREMAANWPRLWHEGDFAGMWSALLNLVTSLAMALLLGTGLWIWLRRQIRRRSRRRQHALAAQ